MARMGPGYYSLDKYPPRIETMPTRPALSAEPIRAACPVCGASFVSYVPGKRGRPAEYCGAPCARLYRAMAELDAAARAVVPGMSTDSYADFRSWLFGTASKGRSLSAERDGSRPARAGARLDGRRVKGE